MSRATPRTVGVGALAVLAVVALNVFVAGDARLPLYWQDEAGYLSNAQVLAGVGDPPHLDGRPYYIAWSLLIAPLWWFLSDGEQVYRGAIVMSMLAGIATLVPLTAIARRCGLRIEWALIAAGVVSLAPGRVLYSNFVVAENFLTLMVALAVWAAFRFAARPRLGNAVALATTTSLAFLTHGRALPLVIATLLWFAWRLRRAPRATLVGIAVTVVVSGLGFLLYRSVVSELYDLTGATRESVGINRILHPDVWAVLLSGTGQLWYLVFAWFALPVFACLVWLPRMAGEWRRRRASAGTWYAVAFLGVAVISFSYMADPISRGTSRLDIYSYGRYLDAFVVPLAVVGMAVVIRGLTRRRGWLVAAVAAVVAATWFALVLPALPTEGGQSWYPINIVGALYLPWRSMAPWLPATPWLYISAIVLAAVVVAIALRRRRVMLVVLLALALTGATIVGELRVMRPYFSEWNVSFTVREALAEPGFARPAVSFDIAGLRERKDGASKNAYQVLLAPRQVRVFDSDDGAPPTELVIAREDWPRGEQLGALRLAVDEGVLDNALWVLPGELQDALLAEGRLSH